MGEDWRSWWRSWQGGTTLAHPDSPMGGGGPGRFQQPGPLGSNAYPEYPVGQHPPHLAHPRSPLARFYHNHFEHLNLVERCHAVLSAVAGSFQYIPSALLEATGQELYAIGERDHSGTSGGSGCSCGDNGIRCWCWRDHWIFRGRGRRRTWRRSGGRRRFRCRSLSIRSSGSWLFGRLYRHKSAKRDGEIGSRR